jgi:hypothetical protein
VPSRDELLLEAGIVLDDAIVHDRQLSRSIKMRLRVAVGRLAVRRPACVGDARMHGSAPLLRPYLIHAPRQVGNPARGLDDR